MTQTAVEEEVRIETSWNRSTGDKPGGRAQTPISLPLKLSMCPSRYAAEIAERKKSNIQGPYKTKQLRVSHFLPGKMSRAQVRRKGNRVCGSADGIESTQEPRATAQKPVSQLSH